MAESWNVGAVRITKVVETETSLPPSGLFPEATPDALAKHASWLQPHFLNEDGQVTLSIHALVVEACGQRILVDTCVGDRNVAGFEALSAEGNPFLERLEEAGHPAGDIDVVLCTHLHFDHVGWNTIQRGGRWVPTFEKARYLFARTEWEHWSQEPAGEGDGRPMFVGNLDDCVRPIIAAGLADFVEADHHINECVRLESTPGHTPGHISVRIESEGERGFITGDMTHHPVQWAEPDWKMMADSDSTQAADTRRRVGASLAADGSLVIGTHYPSPTAGHVVAEPRGLRFSVGDRRG